MALNKEQLLEQAISAEGLEDFGENSFETALDILIASLNDEANLNAAGEAHFRKTITGSLVQRLRIEDWYRQHPETENVEVREPLFGVGLPRTGSTALSFLLAQDPDIRFLRQWESSQPTPPPAAVKGSDPRRVAGTEPPKHGTRRHVPSTMEGPAECLEFMGLSFQSTMFMAFANLPTYAEWLLASDLTRTYEYERRVLKLLQWGETPRPWRLKTPAHTLWLPDLARAFPDARFVMTHRDPNRVLLSNCLIFSDFSAAFTENVDHLAIGESNLHIWKTAVERAMAYRDSGADERFFDIHFNAMQRDPVGEIGKLYDWLDQPVSDEFDAGMRSWWQHNAETREPSVSIDPATYNLGPERITPAFAEYMARVEAWTAR